ncbi:putative flagellar protein FliS [Fusobacterium periodonticum ATCC 33693]|uniref:Putative flagellar protein FliS n=1 Tax=Fusobacterium periodonticum ATCC 33693 TaxID=546275 RepID=D4CWL4_9FUSO|nr:putative flagellar protein FliS [Fusobacterium periodonticum ATCC 33693]
MGKKYLDSAKKYLTQKEYGRMVDILINNKIEITDDLIEDCLINFDINSQRKMEKIIYKLKLFDIEKVQNIALKYAKNSLKYEINNNLKELIYKILASIKDNIEVEQIFVDYYTYYSENKEDPVLEIISSYWED